jgi:hypothetical protein
MKDLRVGDVFRMFEGTDAVVDTEGSFVWEVVDEPERRVIDGDGVLAVMCNAWKPESIPVPDVPVVLAMTCQPLVLTCPPRFLFEPSAPSKVGDVMVCLFDRCQGYGREMKFVRVEHVPESGIWAIGRDGSIWEAR